MVARACEAPAGSAVVAKAGAKALPGRGRPRQALTIRRKKLATTRPIASDPLLIDRQANGVAVDPVRAVQDGVGPAGADWVAADGDRVVVVAGLVAARRLLIRFIAG